MSDWVVKLDDFLKVASRDILVHPGRISHDEALEKAHAEYEQYRRERLNEASPVERDFIEAVRKLKAIEQAKKPGRKKGK